MSLLSRTRPALAAGLALAVLCVLDVGAARAQANKPEKKSVSFKSIDDVELKGTYWTPDKVKKNASVLLLHNFSRTKGGTSHDDAWDDLANELAMEGYNVLSFDFRGHGESKGVGKNFWNFQRFPYNQPLFKKLPPMKEFPTSIDAKDFILSGVSYHLYMVNDIVAAKAFLDDKAGPAAGNTIVIGAGQGATLGLMWMAQEFKRVRDKTENVTPQSRPNLDVEMEGKDLVAGIWLSPSSAVESTQMPTNTWYKEVGGFAQLKKKEHSHAVPVRQGRHHRQTARHDRADDDDAWVQDDGRYRGIEQIRRGVQIHPRLRHRHET